MTDIQREYVQAAKKIHAIRTGKFGFYYHEYDASRNPILESMGFDTEWHFETQKLFWLSLKDEE